MAELATIETSWTRAEAKVTLNITLDACVVPSQSAGVRVDAAHLAVIDDFMSSAACAELLHVFRGDGAGQSQPPDDRWERATSDGPALPRTWGLRGETMAALLHSPPTPLLELQSRLVKLYSDDFILRAFDGGSSGSYSCERCVVNAAVAGDSFAWHVDADPSAIPPPHGGYVNREPGRPLYVSALLYLDAAWPEENDAETLFLDPPTGTGVFVRPKCGRLVLMDQDLLHRLSAPSTAAQRPRYSIVLKLLFHPRDMSRKCNLARPEWGRPAAFGSAARVEAVGRALLQRDAPAPASTGDGGAASMGAGGGGRGRPAPVAKRRASSPPPVEPRPKIPAVPSAGTKRRAGEEPEAAEPPKRTAVLPGAPMDT